MSEPEKMYDVRSSVEVRRAGDAPNSNPKLRFTVNEGDMSKADAGQREITAAKTAYVSVMNYWRTQGLTIDDDGVVQGASQVAPA